MFETNCSLQTCISISQTERRRQTRRVDLIRGQLEADRLQRLYKLTSHVRAWRSLDSQTQESTIKKVRRLVKRLTPHPLTVPSDAAGDLELASEPAPPQPEADSILKDKPSEDLEKSDLDEVAVKEPSAVPKDAPQPPPPV